MNALNDSSRALRSILILASLALFAWASWPARAEWTRERCYARLTNSVSQWNPGVPLRNFKVVLPDGKLGPVLTNRVAVMELLYPGDQICVKATLSSTQSTGPLNPHSVQCHPTGNN